MENIDERLSEYIDKLNAEEKPKEHEEAPNIPEIERLMGTARLVRSLKEPKLPDGDYPKRLSRAVTWELSNNQRIPIDNSLNDSLEDKKIHKGEDKDFKRTQSPRRKWFFRGASIAAVAVMALLLNFLMPFGRTDIVLAMEKAFAQVDSYHGIIEIIEKNEDGLENLQAKLEVWKAKEGKYYVQELEGANQGLTTVNDGKKKWQIRPDNNTVQIFPGFPDPYKFVFELGNEIQDAKNALETEVIGEEILLGRNSAVLKVTPKGGEPYHIWVDKETDLPLQRESGMLNSIQYRVTFTDITPNVDIPKDLFIYELPQGFKEIEKNPEQVVETIKEAGQTAGFSPEAPWALPDGFEKDSIALADNLKTVRQYFKSKDDKTQIILMQGKALKGFKPDSKAIIGKVNGNPAEIQISLEAELGILSGGGAYGGVTDLASIRWQEADFEYAVLGNAPLEVLAQVIKGLSERQVEIPSANAGSEGKPQVEVPVNMEAEENEQKSVDGGHSPWKLDPLYVAQVYVSLIISPEGITGDYPVAYENFKAVKNTGGEAVIEINDDKSPVSRVYLKKLVRNDSTGIWTVIGYDPAK